MPEHKRGFEWFTGNLNFTNIASDGQLNFTLYNAATHGVDKIKGSTITRMLIDMIMRNTAVAQTNQLFWGITIMNADARAAGAFPDADDVSDRADWLVRGRLMGNADSLSDSSQWSRTHLDLRTQRMMRAEEDELQLVMDAGGTGFTLDVSAFVRVLVRTPW